MWGGGRKRDIPTPLDKKTTHPSRHTAPAVLRRQLDTDVRDDAY